MRVPAVARIRIEEPQPQPLAHQRMDRHAFEILPVMQAQQHVDLLAHHARQFPFRQDVRPLQQLPQHEMDWRGRQVTRGVEQLHVTEMPLDPGRRLDIGQRIRRLPPCDIQA